MRILVIDDDTYITDLLKESLSTVGYAVDIANSGEEGESLARNFPYDLIVLDILMPGKNGLEICKSLRQDNIKTLILILTAKREIDDQVQGLDCGADDYLVKPFSLVVLYARVRALLRRESVTSTPHLVAGDLVLNSVTRQAWQKQAEIKLTTKEYSILEYLVHHQHSIVTRNELEAHIWDLSLDSSSNLVDEHVKNLRKKLVDGSIIETVRGVGYRLQSQ